MLGDDNIPFNHYFCCHSPDPLYTNPSTPSTPYPLTPSPPLTPLTHPFYSPLYPPLPLSPPPLGAPHPMLGLAGDGRGGNPAANLALVRQDGSSGGTMNWDQAWYDTTSKNTPSMKPTCQTIVILCQCTLQTIVIPPCQCTLSAQLVYTC